MSLVQGTRGPSRERGPAVASRAPRPRIGGSRSCPRARARSTAWGRWGSAPQQQLVLERGSHSSENQRRNPPALRSPPATSLSKVRRTVLSSWPRTQWRTRLQGAAAEGPCGSSPVGHLEGEHGDEDKGLPCPGSTCTQAARRLRLRNTGSTCRNSTGACHICIGGSSLLRGLEGQTSRKCSQRRTQPPVVSPQMTAIARSQRAATTRGEWGGWSLSAVCERSPTEGVEGARPTARDLQTPVVMPASDKVSSRQESQSCACNPWKPIMQLSGCRGASLSPWASVLPSEPGCHPGVPPLAGTHGCHQPVPPAGRWHHTLAPAPLGSWQALPAAGQDMPGPRLPGHLVCLQLLSAQYQLPCCCPAVSTRTC